MEAGDVGSTEKKQTYNIHRFLKVQIIQPSKISLLLIPGLTLQETDLIPFHSIFKRVRDGKMLLFL